MTQSALTIPSSNAIDRIFCDNPSSRGFSRDYISYTAKVLSEVDHESIERIVERLKAAYLEERTVFIAGNGGSASTASHFMVDLGKGARCPGKPPFRVLSLTDNTALVTAQANDIGYHTVFSSQLEGHVRAGDVAIGISASGNSPNLVEMFHIARQLGATTIGMVGFAGGKMKDLSDICLHVPTEVGDYGPAEDAHSVAQHLITCYLTRWLRQDNVGHNS